MATPLRCALSSFVGWCADRPIPRPLRAPIYRGFARAVGADLAEARRPLDIYPSFSAFFVRRLVDGARPFPPEAGVLPSPCDGHVQAIDPIESGSLLQAKGRPYAVADLVGSEELAAELEGGTGWTIYLSPRDYHRVHSPADGSLAEVRWLGGARRSVAPRVLAGRRPVLATNERVVLRLETERGTLVLVLVGALNVGRMRVVGVEPGRSGRPEPPLRFARGDELGRFEMGSTVVVCSPPGGFVPSGDVVSGDAVRMGEPIGSLAAAAAPPSRAGR